MTITHEKARRLALGYLSKLEEESRKAADLREDLTPRERDILGLPEAYDVLELGLVEEETIEGDFGWVFFWQSKKHLESRDGTHLMIGNAPILISRDDGSLHETGTDRSIEFFIDNFRRTGNTHG